MKKVLVVVGALLVSAVSVIAYHNPMDIMLNTPTETKGQQSVVNSKPRVVELNGELDGASTAFLKKKVGEAQADSNGRILVSISSPGGAVVGGMEGSVFIKYNKELDTYIPVSAASLASDHFMNGHNRFMEPKATILFHGAHGGNEMLTVPGMVRILALMESDQFRADVVGTNDIGLVIPMFKPESNEILDDIVDMITSCRVSLDAPSKSPEELDADTVAKALVSRLGYTGSVKGLKSSIGGLTAANNAAMTSVQQAAAERGISLSLDEIKSKLFGDFELDMRFTGEQMLEMGLIDGVGQPDMARYK